ncbi:hypothetical protein A3Q29_09500 [Providencia stuartii]|uniref:DUF6602 domain-containing protein n=1 Tax=Providencia stuartii TaxID=588 RepID=A0A1S1HKY0_PROST|nr:hypothetical protein A3Q29_09500 [Providencia stuartii]
MNLLKQFQVNLSELLGAVAQGKALHGIKNIADSGAPFEKAFTNMLTRQLPPTYLVKNGYFYSPESQISNEIDIIISLARESFNLEMSQQNKPVLPFTSVITTIQLKNSYSQLNSAIKQSKKSIEHWEIMKNESTQTNILRPISIIICGCNSSNKNIDRQFINTLINKEWLPDYILLLESGIIITKGIPEFEECVSFYQDISLGEYDGFTVDCTNHLEKPALALLWLYTAITSRLSDFEMFELKINTKRHTIFSNAINRKYQLTPIL